MNEKVILKGYKDYLVENVGLTEGSASSYCSYLKRLFQVIEQNDSSMSLLSCSASYNVLDDRGKLQSFVYDLLTGAIDLEPDERKKKALKNGKSSIILFWDYLDDRSEINEEVPAGSITVLNDSKMSFADMQVSPFVSLEKKLFRKRLLSQFRTEPRQKVSGTEVCYPIKAVLGMLNKQQKDRITKRFNKQIDNTEIIVSPSGKTITVGKIEEFRYAPGKQCEVVSNGTVYKVYTRLANNEGFSPLICNEQKEISRDHKYPVSDAMKCLYNAGELQYLTELTKVIYSYDQTVRKPLIWGREGIGIKEARKVLINDNPQFNEYFLNQLLCEFEKIEEKVGGYEIMLNSENAKKGGSNRN